VPAGSEGTARAERRPRRARRCTASQVAASITSTPAGTDADVASSGQRAAIARSTSGPGRSTMTTAAACPSAASTRTSTTRGAISSPEPRPQPLDERRGRRRRRHGGGRYRRLHEQAQPIEEAPAGGGRHPERREIAARVEDPIRELLLGGERPHHPVLDRALADQVDDVDAARLVLAPCPCDTLLEPRRVPRQVEIDHHARDLEV